MDKILKILTYVSQFGLVMIVPVCLCFFAGYWLDGKLGTNFLAIVFFFIGAIAGFTGIYRMIKKENERNKPLGTKERRERNHRNEKR